MAFRWGALHCRRESAYYVATSVRPFQRIAAESRRVVKPIPNVPTETGSDLVRIVLSTCYQKITPYSEVVRELQLWRAGTLEPFTLGPIVDFLQ